MSKAKLITNIGLLQTPEGSSSLRGAAQGANKKLGNASVLIEDGTITAVRSDGLLPEPPPDAEVIDAGGRLATPGLVDAHTHLVFGGWRQHEIPLKLRGATYLDILRAGGGILSTVNATREASEESLFARSMGFLDEMKKEGVTAVEIKSGYGLDTENELKQLRTAARLSRESGLEIIPTFLGAHAVPPEYEGRADDYVELIVNEMLPAVKREGLAEFCDVFLEEAVFDVAQSRRILNKARELGMGLKIHADEIAEIGGSELAGELGARSAEHLVATGKKGIAALARGGTTAVLLPGTSLYLNKTYAPAREMIEAGVPVAIATDFNPGSCPSLDTGLLMTLAYLKYRMTPEETLTAMTLNAACAVDRGKTHGTVEPGKRGGVVLWNAEDMETLCYRFGSNLVYRTVR